MDTGERLAAYLSGDLDPDDRAALEAELAGDAALRARLDRIRASDATLAALEDPTLPEGFADRLQDRLAPELDAVLGDQLAARRGRRGSSRWIPVAGAAAVLALVVAGGIGLITGTGGDDSGEDSAATTLEAGGDRADTGTAQDAPEAAPAPAAGPVVVDRGRSLGTPDLAALADAPDVAGAAASDRIQQDPGTAAQEYASALQGSLSAGQDDAAAEQATESAATGDGAAATGTATRDATVLDDSRVAATDLGEVSAADREAVAACVDVLFQEAAFPVVPVYAELATDEDGTPVIVYVALSPDADGTYGRVEVWMLDRASCQMREYVQVDPQPVDRTAP